MARPLREKLGLNKSPAAAAPAGQPAPPSKPARPPKAEAPTDNVVTYACGCRVGVANLRGRACPACARKSRAAAKARHEEARKGRVAGRLPDGSAFLLTYDAAATEWSGVLTVGTLSFDAKASGVVKLLGVLDAMYRRAGGE
jgi:hypothetical protein